MSPSDHDNKNGAAQPGGNATPERYADSLLDGASPGVAIEEMPVEEHRRSASVQLRGEDVRQVRAASLEAANRSLSEALDIIYRLIVVVMVGLVGLFLLSGFQQVRESEVGIKVAFGAITNAGVEPGFTPSLPKPFGELIIINTAPISYDMNRSFWPQVNDPTATLERSGHMAALAPGRDGSLLTADGNIVHAQLTINYRRSEPRSYLANLYFAGSEGDRLNAEREVVGRAVRRGAVKTVATLTIDEILRRGGTITDGDGERPIGFDPIVNAIQREAQETLDLLETGLTITGVQLKSVSPPGRVIPDFKAVNNAVSEASQRIEQARTEASQTLNRAAGAASQPALALIRQYERAIDAGDEALGDQTLETLRALFNGDLVRAGEPLIVGGQTFTSLGIGGNVAIAMSNARQDADTRTSQARTAARSYQAKLGAYRANPRVFMATEWTRAMLSFMGSNSVEVFVLPPGAKTVRMNVNSDPELARRLEREEFQRQMRENPRFREAMRAGELIQ